MFLEHCPEGQRRTDPEVERPAPSKDHVAPGPREIFLEHCPEGQRRTDPEVERPAPGSFEPTRRCPHSRSGSHLCPRFARPARKRWFHPHWKQLQSLRLWSLYLVLTLQLPISLHCLTQRHFLVW